MTTGTKIFLAVFALIVGVLVIYYGMIVPGNNGTGAKPDDKLVLNQPAAGDGHTASPTNGSSASGQPERRNSPPPREPAPSTPPASGVPNRLSDGGGLLTESVREASGESAVQPGSGGSGGVVPTGDGKPTSPTTPFLPLIGLNAGDLKPRPEDAPKGDIDESPADQPADPPATQPAVPAVQPQPEVAPTPNAPAAAPAVGNAPSRIEFVIAEGDTFVSIAEAWFGDASKWSLIAKENPTVDPQKLKIGQKIYLPPKEAGRTPVRPDPVPAAGETIHVIESGDTLIAIARDHLGDGTRWEEIYALNKQEIGPDPAALKVGMKIKLPKKSN